MRLAELGAADPSRLPVSLFATLLLAPLVTACGGGAPMLHPAHVLPPGEMMVGGGLSGELALQPLRASASGAASPNEVPLQDLAIGPGVAPWAAGRMGFAGSNEAGLTYSGRALRLDVRHAFPIGKAALSVGLGASAVMAQQPSDTNAGAVYGAGADVPVLLGVRNSTDLYAFWFGPRGGFEIMGGGIQPGDPTTLADVQAKHFYAGLTAGTRVGFRHIHLALELNASYHVIEGTFRPAATPSGPSTSTSVQQLSLTPAGALEVTF